MKKLIDGVISFAIFWVVGPHEEYLCCEVPGRVRGVASVRGRITGAGYNLNIADSEDNVRSATNDVKQKLVILAAKNFIYFLRHLPLASRT